MAGRYPVIRLFARLVSVYRVNGARTLLTKLTDRLSPHGRAYRHRKQAEDRAFDAIGYDTGGIQRIYGMETVGDHGANGGSHIATPPEDFRRALAALDIPYDGFTFIDLGSGKGRAVLLAAEEPFGKAIGVEFARELHDVAETNLGLRERHYGPDLRLSVVHADATAWPFPLEPTILFLFHPFDPPVLTAVIRNALASWRANSRPFRVLYLNPVHQHDWIEEGWRLLSAHDGVAVYAPPDPA